MQNAYRTLGFWAAASAHVAGKILKSVTGINLVHVPYKGGILAVTEMGKVHKAAGVEPD